MLLPRAIVLAGGRSQRFGSDKALARIGDQTLIGLIISGLLRVFARVLVVTKDPTALGVRSDGRVKLVLDPHPEHAALIGIAEGLRRTDRMLNYITGCDMPGVVPELITELYRLARGADCALRCNQEGQIEPLGGFYSTRAICSIDQLIAQKQLRIRDALSGLDVRTLPFEAVARLDPELRSFWNVNTPDDLAGVAEKLRQ